ncbi:transmembrane protein 26 [Ischnura elegans]|uniref:transmembrane protein 26 n=1 Tax=Ischnura elegans TaxID=197161 RepID=UPI001ED8B3B3|nr:transmembrane protein 26 [Ischnura elegans]
MARVIATVKAVVTRLVFAAHGLLAIWQAVARRREPTLWYLSLPIMLLFFEGLFTLTVKRNQEWKWFCPSVFLYLGSVVPAIWLLELDKLNKRLAQLAAAAASLSEASAEPQIGHNGSGVTDAASRAADAAVTLNVTNPPTWVTLLEQSLMLALILGRWLLPKGELSREQLSQLLLVYIGTAADIIEFLDSFKEDRVARQPVLVTLTLSIWAWSLLQFTLVLTATKARRSRMSSATHKKTESDCHEICCCSVDAWAIVINMVLQDAPFVAFRLLLIIHFRIVSYLNVFFACKNTLVILLQLYRLYVVQVERRKQARRRKGR